MSLTTIMLIIMGALAIALVILLLVLKKQKKRYNRSIKFIDKKRSSQSYFWINLLYRLYNNTPVLSKYFKKTKNKIKILYPSDPVTINKKTTQMFSKSFIILFGVCVGVILISGGDLFFCAMGIFTGFVLFKASIDSKAYKMECKLLREFERFVSDFPLTYRENHGLIEDALLDSIEKLSYELGIHISNIYDIIVSPNIEEALNSYMEYSPNKYILMFVSLCVTVKEYGDKELDDGSTAFLKGVMNLEKQLNTEMLRRQEIENNFQSLTVIAIAPVLAIKPVEWWGTSMMEDIASFYTGIFGITCMFAIFLASFLCYSMVIHLKTTNNDTFKETSIWKQISDNRFLSPFFNNQVRQHYTTALKINNMMRNTGDNTGPKAFLCQCLGIAIAGFIATCAIFTTGQIQSMRNTATNITNDFDNVVVPNDNYIEILETFDQQLLDAHLKDKEINEDSLRQELRNSNAVFKNETYQNAVIESFMTRYNKYHNTYFRYWYLLVAIFVAVAGFFSPYLMLWFKNRQVHIGKEDEVNSFNTLMLIFMHMDGINVGIILEWMERFSYFYKENISECIVNFERNEQKALQQLMESDPQFEFQKFVKGLIKIDDIGPEKAFEDLESQQDYYNRRREQHNKKITMSKSIQARRFAFTPMWACIILYLIVPLFYYGITMLLSMMSSMNLSV